MIKLDWIYLPETFGILVTSKHLWMLGYSILWLRATLISHYLAATERMRRKEHTKNVFEMLSMVLSHALINGYNFAIVKAMDLL